MLNFFGSVAQVTVALPTTTVTEWVMRLLYRHPLVILCSLALITFGSYQWVFKKHIAHSQQLSAQHAIEFNQYINLQLTRFSTLTDTLAQRPELQRLLQQPASLNKQQAVSQLLADFNLASGSASIYVMDPQGIVLASSNANQAIDFMGYNFGFRPYFTETISANKSYVDYGLGWISRERGIYFAATVTDQQQQILGVLTIKLNIDQLELAYQSIANQSPFYFMLVDEEQTVIASNYEPWRLTWLGEQAVSRSRHPGVILHSLNLQQDGALWQLLTEPVTQPTNSKQFVVAIKENPVLPWQLVLLQPVKSLKVQALQQAISISLVFTVAVLFFVFWRSRLLQQRQRALMFTKLEQAVAERTESLQQSNQQLMHEIQQRNEAEQGLQQAQEQLLQAAKLATIGQLSASINHEINQPLTAMHSYLQNAQLLLQKARYSELADNLEKIRQMLLRLNHIVKQFKGFSRKAGNNPEPVKLSTLVQNALGILQPIIKQQQVQITLLETSASSVKVDPLQLEQVLVNLLGNAIQATEQSQEPRLKIEISQTQTAALLQIHDNGPGIQPHVMEHLFEPFFTTKQGSGLGLGLSISRQIVQSYHGNLHIENHPAGGVIVTLTLPRYHSEYI
ncbi:sensor histidine kinase [Alishewanella sp. d11]|uniref:sensor histidine kinase n=1 Tax=Alishewanella sp. d11 TaxID=3414030 RepID=UPI003BF91DDA